MISGCQAYLTNKQLTLTNQQLTAEDRNRAYQTIYTSARAACSALRAIETAPLAPFFEAVEPDPTVVYEAGDARSHDRYYVVRDRISPSAVDASSDQHDNYYVAAKTLMQDIYDAELWLQDPQLSSREQLVRELAKALPSRPLPMREDAETKALHNDWMVYSQLRGQVACDIEIRAMVNKWAKTGHVVPIEHARILILDRTEARGLRNRRDVFDALFDAQVEQLERRSNWGQWLESFSGWAEARDPKPGDPFNPSQ